MPIDNVGNRASVSYPNGVITTYSYDDLNRLIYMETANTGAQIINSYIYTLDNAGNRTRVVEHNGRTVDYIYDNLYRLTAEDITDAINGNQSISYTYDDVGNRLTKTVDGVVTSYDYDNNNRLTSETTSGDTITYGYDNNGNQIQKLSATEDIAYGYNYENRLVSVDDNASLILYQYDVDGIKTRKTVDGTVTKYLIDKNRDYAQVLEEIDGTGTLVVNYVYGDDLISQNRSGTDSYYHYDGIGSTRALTDDLGAETDTYNYEAFGTLLNKTGNTDNNYLFTGEQYDPNLGFYYLRARWMNPEIGRFVTTDLWEGVQNDPVTMHKYLYANANPVKYVDPSGRFSFMETVTVVGLQCALVGAIMPNLNMLGYYYSAGRTDHYELIIGYGGGIGDGPYFGVSTAYFVELQPSNGRKIKDLIKNPRRGVFQIYLLGVGFGASAQITGQRIEFFTRTNRNFEVFKGIGNIVSGSATAFGVGPSVLQIRLADGTLLAVQVGCDVPIPPNISIPEPGFDFSGYITLAYFKLVTWDYVANNF